MMNPNLWFYVIAAFSLLQVISTFGHSGATYLKAKDHSDPRWYLTCAVWTTATGVWCLALIAIIYVARH